MKPTHYHFNNILPLSKNGTHIERIAYLVALDLMQVGAVGQTINCHDHRSTLLHCLVNAIGNNYLKLTSAGGGHKIAQLIRTELGGGQRRFMQDIGQKVSLDAYALYQEVCQNYSVDRVPWVDDLEPYVDRFNSHLNIAHMSLSSVRIQPLVDYVVLCLTYTGLYETIVSQHGAALLQNGSADFYTTESNGVLTCSEVKLHHDAFLYEHVTIDPVWQRVHNTVTLNVFN